MTIDTLRALDPSDSLYATRFVDQLLAAAVQVAASDVHLQPTAAGIELAWRLDGVLHPLGIFPVGSATNVIARLKVLAELLTYRTDTPQEGRIRVAGQGFEMRVSTFPTLFGERAVVRITASTGQLLHLDDLGLPGDISDAVRKLLGQTSGTLLITGPAGSGKTTSAYACLRELNRDMTTRRCAVSIEDPIEAVVPGVAQSQVNLSAGFDLALGLRSILRQDPEVLLVGEIRDRATAEGVFGAALTGHFVLTTFHAGSAAGAISRLADMGIEPYQLRSAVAGVLSQRLARRLCDCATWSDAPQARGNFDVERARVAVGCSACQQSGYRGRFVLAELLLPAATDLGRAILSREDSIQLERLARQTGMIPLHERATQAVAAGVTSIAEVFRVLGTS